MRRCLVGGGTMNAEDSSFSSALLVGALAVI